MAHKNKNDPTVSAKNHLPIETGTSRRILMQGYSARGRLLGKKLKKLLPPVSNKLSS